MKQRFTQVVASSASRRAIDAIRYFLILGRRQTACTRTVCPPQKVRLPRTDLTPFSLTVACRTWSLPQILRRRRRLWPVDSLLLWPLVHVPSISKCALAETGRSLGVWERRCWIIVASPAIPTTHEIAGCSHCFIKLRRGLQWRLLTPTRRKSAFDCGLVLLTVASAAAATNSVLRLECLLTSNLSLYCTASWQTRYAILLVRLLLLRVRSTPPPFYNSWQDSPACLASMHTVPIRQIAMETAGRVPRGCMHVPRCCSSFYSLSLCIHWLAPSRPQLSSRIDRSSLQICFLSQG